MFCVLCFGGGGTMNWLPGSAQMYSQPSNQGFPCTRQSTQLLARSSEGGSVAGYWQSCLRIHLKILHKCFLLTSLSLGMCWVYVPSPFFRNWTNPPENDSLMDWLYIWWKSHCGNLFALIFGTVWGYALHIIVEAGCLIWNKDHPTAGNPMYST